jgi:hexosaminidase
MNNRLVHIDLKGAPLRLNYLESLLPFLSKIGVNGLLIEYEDMFPYNQYLKTICCEEVYSNQEIESIIRLANENELKIIPLIQTFGHLEFVLKHELFRDLREFDSYPNSICPTNQKSLEVIKDMIKQIVCLHQKFTKLDAIHIGCDEVWHLAHCQQCKQVSIDNQWTHKSQLFLDFVSKIANFVRKTFSIDVIIWDDMIRETDTQLIVESNLHNLVQPMIWHYLDINSFQLRDEQFWDKYTKLFARIWIATAFKGASKMNQLIAPIPYHISNHLAWIQVIDKFRISNIEGIALTGWQRFDHFTTLCELFPNSITSLLMCLFTLNEKTFDQRVHQKASDFLNNRELLPIEVTNMSAIDSIDSELFPGAVLFKLCLKWKLIAEEFHVLKSNPRFVSIY